MNKEAYLADEVLMIADGGEMPEVAFNASLYYLTKDGDGPSLCLGGGDLLVLKRAVIQRFGFIVLRDILPENRCKSIYRGLERSYLNWLRLLGYCQRENLAVDTLAEDVAATLSTFLQVELVDVCDRGKTTCVNCTVEQLQDYAEKLNLDLDGIAPRWHRLF